MSDNEGFGTENTTDPRPENDNYDAAEENMTEAAPESDAPSAQPEEQTSGSPAEAGAENGEKEPEKPARKPVKVPLFAAVVAVLAVAVLVSQITFLAVRQSYHKKLATIEKERFADSKLSEVDEIYRKNYINEISDDKLTDGLILGYIYGAGDKYGSYMTQKQYEDYIKSMNSKSTGIGASVIWNSDHYAIEIINVYEGSPAEEAGILDGDLIVEVDGTQISSLGFDAGVAAVKGEEGTKVKLTVCRGENYEQELQIEVVRREITVKTVTFTPYGEVAVIRISDFYTTTPTELKAAVSQATAAGCDRIVFDMRNNTGGYLDSVANILDFLLPEGVVVRMRNAANEWTEIRSDASCVDMPMVVLVNGRTASAAELFTSALMDYDYAEVVGTQTFGKGTVTYPFTLSDGSAIYISIEHYYPPKSDNFEGKGITPDHIVELDENVKNINFYKLTYENDNQLQKAIEIIKEK